MRMPRLAAQAKVTELLYSERQRFFPHQPTTWLDAQVQVQFAIDPIDAPCFHVTPFTLRKYRKQRPKLQLLCLLLRRTSQSAAPAFSASSLAR